MINPLLSWPLEVSLFHSQARGRADLSITTFPYPPHRLLQQALGGLFWPHPSLDQWCQWAPGRLEPSGPGPLHTHTPTGHLIRECWIWKDLPDHLVHISHLEKQPKGGREGSSLLTPSTRVFQLLIFKILSVFTTNCQYTVFMCKGFRKTRAP